MLKKILITFFFTDHFKRAPVLETLSFPHQIPKGIFQNPRAGGSGFQRENPNSDLHMY